MTDSTKLGESLALVQQQKNEEIAIGGLYSNTQHDSRKNQKVLGFAFFSFFSFTCIEMVFALTAHSTSLMADAAAMFVDAGTYLCNLIAERLKDRPPTEKELQLPEAIREYKRKLRCLNLEIFPPLVSMSLLLYITYTATLESIHTLQVSNGEEDKDEDEADANVMMFFGILFLVIDFVNMFCFSTVNGTMIPISHLPFSSNFNNGDRTLCEDDFALDDDDEHIPATSNPTRMNLNMCSAWTHVFADTLRSSTILVAGILPFLFKDVPSDISDAWAALFVSLIIFISCIPLLQGIVGTMYEIREVMKAFQDEYSQLNA